MTNASGKENYLNTPAAAKEFGVDLSGGKKPETDPTTDPADDADPADDEADADDDGDEDDDAEE